MHQPNYKITEYISLGIHSNASTLRLSVIEADYEELHAQYLKSYSFNWLSYFTTLLLILILNFLL